MLPICTYPSESSACGCVTLLFLSAGLSTGGERPAMLPLGYSKIVLAVPRAEAHVLYLKGTLRRLVRR